LAKRNRFEEGALRTSEGTFRGKGRKGRKESWDKGGNKRGGDLFKSVALRGEREKSRCFSARGGPRRARIALLAGKGEGEHLEGAKGPLTGARKNLWILTQKTVTFLGNLPGEWGAPWGRG